jgi:hypothetical protein
LDINWCEKVTATSLLHISQIATNLQTILAMDIKLRGKKSQLCEFIER